MEVVAHHFYIILFLSIGLIIKTKSESCKKPLSLSGSGMEVFDQLTDPCRYDKLSRPYDEGRSTHVYVRMHVYSLGPIDVQNLQYTIQMLLRYRWKDPRLQPNAMIEHEGDLITRIWTPHGYILNEQSSHMMGSTMKDTVSSIQPDGTVILSLRMRVTLHCIMDLQKFPFDSQHCPLTMESWSYNASQLTLEWEENSPITLDRLIELTEYTLEDVTIDRSTIQYGEGRNESTRGNYSAYFGKAVGNFSSLTVNFAFKREYGFYIMDYYIPSILIVVVSWVTFWLDANASPARTCLGTSTMLTFITLSKNIGASLPKVSYVKSSEIWFIGCTAFIFSSLAEFAFVNIICRRRKDVSLEKITGKHILQSTIVPQIYHKNVRSKSLPSIVDSQYGSAGTFSQMTLSVDGLTQDFEELAKRPHPLPNGNCETQKNKITMTPHQIANWIDKRSRLVFPIAFLFFNCIYWSWTFVLL